MCVTDELSASSGDVSPTHIVRRCESAPTFFFLLYYIFFVEGFKKKKIELKRGRGAND
jgi:hypothetical protein